MQMNEMQFSEGVPVDGYGPGFFRIAGQVVQGPICLGPTGLCAWRGYDNLDPLMALADAVDVIFVGTGAEIAFLPDPVRQCLEKASFGVEPMIKGVKWCKPAMSISLVHPAPDNRVCFSSR